MGEIDPCTACGTQALGKFGLPVLNGEIVDNDVEEWDGGVRCCEGCHNVHAAGGPFALRAHIVATIQLREEVASLRRTLARINEVAEGSV